MTRILRSTLSGAMVLCAAALAACSDSPTGGLREESSDALVSAANRNVGGGARVFQVGRDEQTSATIQTRGTGAPAQALSPYPYRLCRDVDDENCYTPTRPTPIYTVFAQKAYGSDASAITEIVANGTILKTLTLSSYSQAIANVASTTLSVSFRNVGGQTSCTSVAGQFDSSYSQGNGSPLYLSSSRDPAWQGVIKWEVVGTHGFTPVAGAGGGGTFNSSDFTCG